MRLFRKSNKAFRPTVENQKLEDRVVLSTAGSAAVSGIVNNGNFQLPQVRRAFANQVRVASRQLRDAINTEVNTLYATGQPNQQQVTDFAARVQGAVNATALRLSAQQSLLPNASARLLPRMQQALLGSGRNSLSSRLAAITARPNAVASPLTLRQQLERPTFEAFNTEANRLGNYFNTTSVRRLSVDQTGQRVPVRAYLAAQTVNQFANTLGSISQSFPNFANTALFSNGVIDATPENVASFLNQGTGALGTAAYQLGSTLALFPNASTGVIPQLQNGLFGTGRLNPPGNGTGTGSNSPTTPEFDNFLNVFQGLPTSSTNFGSAVNTAFNSGLQNLGGSLNNYFGFPSTGSLSLPTQPTSLFGSNVGTFGNGFNNGFGTGFVGFGQAPTNFNTNFGTGFNNVLTTVNPGFGFNVPTSVFNVPPTSVGGGLPTGTGNPLPGSGTTGGTTF